MGRGRQRREEDRKEEEKEAGGGVGWEEACGGVAEIHLAHWTGPGRHTPGPKTPPRDTGRGLMPGAGRLLA